MSTQASGLKLTHPCYLRNDFPAIWAVEKSFHPTTTLCQELSGITEYQITKPSQVYFNNYSDNSAIFYNNTYCSYYFLEPIRFGENSAFSRLCLTTPRHHLCVIVYYVFSSPGFKVFTPSQWTLTFVTTISRIRNEKCIFYSPFYMSKRWKRFVPTPCETQNCLNLVYY